MFTAKEFNTIKFDLKDGVGIITINREDKLNALNRNVLEELKDLLTSLEVDKNFSLKGLILTGAGEKSFIAGADIAEMVDMTPEEATNFGKLGQDVTLLFESSKVPIIACVSGYALGGGCEMAMGCDFIYATESSIFGQPEVKLGLIPGFGGTQRLAKLVGRNHAKEIIYSGRNIKADEARALGLVVKSFATKQEMLDGAMKTFSYIFKNSSMAIATVKKAMNAGNDLSLAQGLACELESFGEIFKSDDMKEGTAAFIEKRKPKFTGQ